MKQVIAQSKSRTRHRSRITWASGHRDMTSPIVAVDKHVWTAPDLEHASSTRSGSVTLQSLVDSLPYYELCCISDEELDDHAHYGDRRLDFLLYDEYRVGSAPRVETDRAYADNIPQGCPVRPLQGTESFTDPFSLLRMDGSSFTAEYIDDTVTLNYLDCIKAKVILNNPCFRFKASFDLQPVSRFYPIRHGYRDSNGKWVAREIMGYLLIQYFIVPDQLFVDQGFYRPWAMMGFEPYSFGDKIRYLIWPNESGFPNLETQCQQDLLRAASYATRGQLDILTELAESSQTVEFTYGFLRKLAAFLKLLRNVKRGDVTGIRLALKKMRFRRMPSKKRSSKALKMASNVGEDVANAWLEYRYGLLQLYYSARDSLLSTLAWRDKHLRTTFSHREYYPGATTNTLDTRYVVDSQLANDAPLLDTEIGTAFSSFRHRLYGKYNHSAGVALDGNNDDMLSRLTAIYGRFNLPQMVWEEIPYSFVLDWACNIGDLCALSGMNPAKITRQWNTLVYDTGSETYARCDAVLGATELRDMLFAIPGIDQLSPSNPFYRMIWLDLNDDETVYNAVYLYRLRVAFRGVPSNSSVLDWRLSFSDRLPSWQQWLDLAALLKTFRIVR